MNQTRTPEAPPANASGDAQRLAEAFRLFTTVSDELSAAYSGLQNQVERLTGELAVANGELRRQYQEKAAISERLALLLNALPAGVLALDGADAVDLCNPAAERLLGAAAEGSHWQELASRSLSATDTPGEWHTNAGGRRIAVSESPLDSAGGRIVLLHDITEAHALQARAQRNERLAAMGEMAASLAHQLRTPLAAALLYAGNLARADLAQPERERCADRMVERLKALERLIQDVLLFARGEALGREVLEAGALAAEAARLIEPVARDRGVSFAMFPAAASATVHGNLKALAGALVNLLDNALQACPTGGRVTLDVHCDDATARFVVRDTGCGIAPADQARLFEPFFSTRAHGTGLGLAIARGVARAHGGQIVFSSVAGTGSEFALVLPVLGPASGDSRRERDGGLSPTSC